VGSTPTVRYSTVVLHIPTQEYMPVRNNTKNKLPNIPKRMFSVLGPVPVTMQADLESKENALGISRFKSRTVQLHAGSSSETVWQTFFHEMTHVAMWDAGCHDILKHKQREAICNAMGTYLAAAVQAGYLKMIP